MEEKNIDSLLSEVNENNANDLINQIRLESKVTANQSSFQDEIDRMLGEIEVAPKNETSQNAAKLPAQSAAQSAAQDFYSDSYPHKCTKEQLSAVYKTFEKFVPLAIKSLSAFYGKQVHVSLASIDQLTMGDFIRTLPNPTSIAIVNMEPLKGNAVIEIGHPMDISSLSPAIFESLRTAWSGIIDLQPKMEKSISKPELINFVPMTEGAVVITFEAKFGITETMMNFCFPYSAIFPILHKIPQY